MLKAAPEAAPNMFMIFVSAMFTFLILLLRIMMGLMIFSLQFLMVLFSSSLMFLIAGDRRFTQQQILPKDGMEGIMATRFHKAATSIGWTILTTFILNFSIKRCMGLCLWFDNPSNSKY